MTYDLNAIEKEFNELTKEWKEGTKYLSFMGNPVHPAYLRIIEMGWKVVPLILYDLSKEPHHWFLALYEITGENPIKYEDRGNVKKMADYWLEWGKKKGLLVDRCFVCNRLFQVKNLDKHDTFGHYCKTCEKVLVEKGYLVFPDSSTTNLPPAGARRKNDN